MRLRPLANNGSPGGAGGGGGGSGSGGAAGGPGGSGGGGGGPSSCQQIPSCPGGAVVTGKVYAPNGTDPIAGASVYIPTGTDEFPPGLSCDICSQGGFSSCAHTFSGIDGSFTLSGAPTGMTEIDLQKGRFRRRLHLSLSCGTTMLSPDQSRLPRNGSEGDLPKIAVANGDWDKLECVLRKIGLDASAIDVFNHTLDFSEAGKPDLGSLVANLDQLKSYHIVFINCSDNSLESYLSQPQVVGNLHSYVSMGGRLYVTDWSYDHVEQVPQWAPLVCWQGSSCPQTPEPMHAAALGRNGLEVNATIEDMNLKQWLTELGATNPDGTVHITHFLDQWIMQKSNVAPVREWVRGPVQSGDGSINALLPLTFTFDYNGCGRVLYSSYHTLGRDNDLCGLGGPGCHFPDYCDGSPLSPQERILEYLIFEISTCVNPPG
ncbi:MAG TPA: hypothetical protein VKN99_12725 [Polyangia bacterium]|nr:hypothetical protein [Polyangia bacterium]